MATYNNFLKTNYFSVTDENKFMDICRKVKSNTGDKLEIVSITESDQNKFSFCCYGTPIYDCEKSRNGLYNEALEELLNELQSVVAFGDAIIIKEIGQEKLRFLNATAYIITKDDIKFIDFDDYMLSVARQQLDDVNWDTRITY